MGTLELMGHIVSIVLGMIFVGCLVPRESREKDVLVGRFERLGRMLHSGDEPFAAFDKTAGSGSSILPEPGENILAAAPANAPTEATTAEIRKLPARTPSAVQVMRQ